MQRLDHIVTRDISGKISPDALQVLESATSDATDFFSAALTDNGKTLIAITDTGITIAREKSAPTAYTFEELHSISVLGDTDPVLFAPLRRDAPFDAVSMSASDAARLVEAARPRIAALHLPGEKWWDTPMGDLGVAIWVAGLLTRPASSPVPERQWCTVSFVNTGVQIRTVRNPKQPSVYKEDSREFLPWPSVRNVSVEGVDQIERRPSVGAVLAFGVLGLGASREVRRSYFVIEANVGDYVFERQDMLPLQLSGYLTPVLRQMRDTAQLDDPMKRILETQTETNRLLAEILDALRQR